MNTLIVSLHYYALGIGFLGIGIRTIGLKDSMTNEGPLHRVYLGDNLWGFAALLWIATGSFRVFGGYDKGSVYYFSNNFFLLKLVLFGIIFLLETYTMFTLIRWRLKSIKAIGAEHIPIIRRMFSLSIIELGLLFLIPLLASAMARGGF